MLSSRALSTLRSDSISRAMRSSISRTAFTRKSPRSNRSRAKRMVKCSASCNSIGRSGSRSAEPAKVTSAARSASCVSSGSSAIFSFAASAPPDAFPPSPPNCASMLMARSAAISSPMPQAQTTASAACPAADALTSSLLVPLAAFPAPSAAAIICNSLCGSCSHDCSSLAFSPSDCAARCASIGATTSPSSCWMNFTWLTLIVPELNSFLSRSLRLADLAAASTKARTSRARSSSPTSREK